MRNRVLKFLKDGSGLPEERYNLAMELYRKSDGHSIPAANYYNRAGFTMHNLDNICYDLKKIHNINAMDISNFSMDEKNIPNPGVDIGQNSLGLVLLPTPDEGVGATTDPQTPQEIIDSAPEDAKVGLKLIEEFPFLDDADCPDKLKILVQDKFTAWRNYQKLHAALLVAVEEGKDPIPLSNAEIFELAKGALENFDLNRAIYDELNYYKEHREILGKHPIFADEILKEKVAKLSDAAALTRRNNLRTYISRDTPKIEKAKTEASGNKLRVKVQEWTGELNLLDARLGEQK